MPADYQKRNNRHKHYIGTVPKAQRKERYPINTNKTSEINYTYVTRRIGSTTFKVKVVFCDTGEETMEDKILRIIRNEALETGEKRGIMETPQMSRQSERSA